MRVRATHAAGVLVLAAALGWLEEAHASTQVRGVQATSRRLIADSLTRSETIRRLARTIEASDVIVYVDLRRDLASHVVGAMRFVASTTTHRVVRIALNQDYAWPALIAFLGHELQHACELAAARGVNSAERVRAYYRQFGIRVDRDAYDSREAQAITRRVEAELRGTTSEEERLALLRHGSVAR